MNKRLTLLILLVGLFAAQPQSPPQEKSHYTLPADPRQAWAELQKAHEPLQPPDSWRTYTPTTEEVTEFHQQVCQSALLFADKAREFVARFPTNQHVAAIYTMLATSAKRASGDIEKQLAKEILDAPGAPASAKTYATHVLAGIKPYDIGKPLDIRFTALDGREIDLAKMRGKVVLVEFWATWCGPCVAQMPELKAVYEKFHDRGFEVIAISLDTSEPALRRFITEKKLSWPQYFDGKAWENRFAAEFMVEAVPQMWLVDRKGNLRTTSARMVLKQLVPSMIDEPTS